MKRISRAGLPVGTPRPAPLLARLGIAMAAAGVPEPKARRASRGASRGASRRASRGARLNVALAAVPLLACAALLMAGCERPFVDIQSPEIEVLSPDPALLQTASEQTLRVRATSFRSVARVLLDEEEMIPQGGQIWETRLTLAEGVNRFKLTAYDISGSPREDSVHFLHLPIGIGIAENAWPDAVGGHAAALLPGGEVLITGGAPTTEDFAVAASRLFYPASEAVSEYEVALESPRAGHTMTLLPDGSFIVAGGSRVAFPVEVADLVESVERILPDGSGIGPMTVVGDPIRRAYHTAAVRRVSEGLILELLGGTGDVRYRPEPVLGVRNDLRQFLIRGDTLEALLPAPGLFVEPLSGHIQVDLDGRPAGQSARFLTAGSVFGEINTDHFAFILDTRSPSGIFIDDVPLPSIGRNGAAAARVAAGRVVRLGGLTGPGFEPSASGDVFDLSLGRFVRLPDLGQILPATAFGTATFLPDGRILLLGGFGPDGTSSPTITYLELN